MKTYLMIVLLFVSSVLYATEESFLNFKYIGTWQLLGISAGGSEAYLNGDMRNMVIIDADEITIVGIDETPKKIKSITVKIDSQGIKITTILMKDCKFYYVLHDTSANSIMFKVMIVENNTEQMRFILGMSAIN